jgi:hypothetical protein
VHVDWPPGENLPNTHGAGSLAGFPQLEPDGQGVQFCEPVDEAYLPSGQASQVTIALAEYLPATHTETTPPAHALPAMQGVQELAPTPEEYPAAQSEHAVAPLVA